MNRLINYGGLAVVLAIAGCGGGSNTADMGGSPDMAPLVETCTTDNLPATLAAHYGVKGTLNVNVKVPADCTDACILDKDAVSSIYLLVDVTQAGATAAITAKACKIVIPPVALKGQPMPTTLTASDALVQSVKAVTSTGMLSGANTCAGFASQGIPILLGTRLTAPASDPLPVFNMSMMPPVKLCGGMSSVKCDAAADVACICDQEGDGKAGATVGAAGVPAFDDVDQVYLALRTVVQLDGVVFPASPGQVTPGQRLKGTITGLKLEQSPVGCHHSPTGGGAPYDCTATETDSVAKLNPLVKQSVNNPSTFVGMPVPDGYSCSDLITNASILFKNQ